jgi:rhamnosyltransferase
VPTISVVIPTYQAGRYLPKLLAQLKTQDMPAEVVIIDSSSTDETVKLARQAGCIVEVISKASFRHGATRNRGAELATGEILVFMTQDALPVNEHFLRELTAPLNAGQAAAAFARQLPYPDAPLPEVFTRGFNYPSQSQRRTRSDIAQLGIKAFFFSDVSSSVLRSAFEQVGTFPAHVIMNEDMLLCAKLLKAGHAVCYCADAQVYHSHSYSLWQQFRRYFDIGVFMAQASESLAGARAGGEGFRYVREQSRYLAAKNAWFQVVRSLCEAGVKLTAFELGKRERYLPLELKRRLSMNSSYWLPQTETAAPATSQPTLAPHDSE